jgi:hypothetical protein
MVMVKWEMLKQFAPISYPVHAENVVGKGLDQFPVGLAHRLQDGLVASLKRGRILIK